MVYQNQLQRNTGIVDPLVFNKNIEASYFHYIGFRTVKNFYKFYRELAPDKAGVTWRGTTEFKIPPNADKLGPLILEFDVGPINATVNQNQQALHLPRYVDWLGYYAWSKITLEYGPNELYTLYPDEQFIRAKQSYDIQRQDALKELVAGERTDARREALATTTQRLYVELMFPHSRSTNRWLEIMQCAVEPRVSVHWKPLHEIVQLSNSTLDGDSSLLSNVKLRTTLVHLEGDERDENTARIENIDGVTRYTEEFRYEKFTREFTQGTSGEVFVKLNNFRTAAKNIILLLRKLAEVRPGANDSPNYTNLQPIASFYLEASDGRIFEPIDDRFARFYLHPQWHIAPCGDNIYEWSWAMEPDDALNCTGSLNLGGASNLLLKITLPAALDEDCELTVITKEHNFIQHSRGDLAKTFR